MKVVGSIIACLGNKCLPYKNLLSFGCKTMLQLGVEKLQQSKLVNKIIISTESKLIAQMIAQLNIKILQKSPKLAQNNVPSISLFQHILRHYPGDEHVNLNINFALCQPEVIDRAVEITIEKGEILSKPYDQQLFNYGDFPDTFDDSSTGTINVHTKEDLFELKEN